MSSEPPLLEIKLLRLLDQPYTTRSVTRSAEALGQSQPTLSIWLARLLAHALQAGEADLAVGFLPWLDAGFYQQTLYAQDWICLAYAQHPRVIDASPENWNLDVYQAEAHIGISSGP